MPDAHVALEVKHLAGIEDIPDQAVIFAEIKPGTVTGNYTGCILSPVLQDRQAVEQRLVDV